LGLRSHRQLDFEFDHHSQIMTRIALRVKP
jgi:hypothetical protein